MPSGRRGTLKRIHVDQHRIRANARVDSGSRLPPIKVKQGAGANAAANQVVILDSEGVEVARVVYRPDRPLGCGARVWVETRADVVVVDEPAS